MLCSRFPRHLLRRNPYYLRYFWAQSAKFKGTAAWHSFGGIFLSVTGAEALFADQGHFGVRAIALSWFGLAYPMLLLTYSGQAAWLLKFGDLTDPANPALCFSISGAGSGAAPFSTYLATPAPVPGCSSEGFIGIHGGAAGPNGIISNVFW